MRRVADQNPEVLLFPFLLRLAVVAVATLVPQLSLAAPTAAQKCEAAVETATAKFGQCRLNAEAKFTKNGDAGKRTSSLERCSSRLSSAFAKATAVYGTACPATEPVGEFDAFLAQCTDQVQSGAGGGQFPSCGDGVVNRAGEQCDGSDLGGETCAALGLSSGAVSCDGTCRFNTSACAVDAASYCGPGTMLGTGGVCEPKPQVQLLATGLTEPLKAVRNGSTTPVTVPDDSTLQFGVARTVVDNGDGTLTDLRTRLMWEKKCNDGGLHDRDNRYVWTGTGSQETIWDWIEAVNAEGGAGFAGYSDWRIPNVNEAASFLVPRAGSLLVAGGPTDCDVGCNVLDCNCGPVGTYTSTGANNLGNPDGVPSAAWLVAGGAIFQDLASGDFHVLAVRGPIQ